MRRQLVPAVIAILLFTAITLLYGVGTTLADQVLFKHKADGSLVKDAKGQVVGSSLIGQDFTKEEYFHPRPAADGYASGPDYSYGSNYGPTNPALIGNVPGVSIDDQDQPVRDAERPVLRAGAVDRQGRQPDHRQGRQPGVRQEQGRHLRVRPEHRPRARPRVPGGERPRPRRTPVPVDAVTASGSGLDPQITVANAKLQAPRVAAARHMPLAAVLALGQGQHRRARVRHPRRAGRQRARAQPRARPAINGPSEVVVGRVAPSLGRKRMPMPGSVRK